MSGPGPAELLKRRRQLRVTMKPIPIARRLTLAHTPHLLADADGVLSAADLGAVSHASDLVRAVRSRCAARLRRTRRLQQERLARQRAACEAMVLSRAAQLSQQLQEERRGVRDAAATLVAQVARDALQRLMVELPDAWPAQSSVQLVLAEWSALALKEEATVSLHPADLPLITPLRADLPWTLAADPSLPRGACVLSHSAGTVRADFHANVQALSAALQSVPVPPADPAPGDLARADLSPGPVSVPPPTEPSS